MGWEDNDLFEESSQDSEASQEIVLSWENWADGLVEQLV